MKNSIAKVISGLMLSVFTLWLNPTSAQLVLDCESGNRAIEQGACWAFGATGYTSTAASIISGSWSLRSNSLTNPAPTACWVKTPWMQVGSGDITFDAKFEGTAGTTRGIELYYIPYDAGNAPYFEGTPVQFSVYNWEKPWSTTVPQSFTVPIPVDIANSTDAYKIRVSFVGTGGTARIISDNFVFPGVYYSDPSNNCLPLGGGSPDADGDGVADSEDDYPEDAYRAYNNFYPSASTFGTLAFEDNWPARGDYDMNDVVVDYRLKTVTNALNQVVETIGYYKLRASGASFRNGFGFKLDNIVANKVIEVIGYETAPDGIFSVAGNGLEEGQTDATVIVFDNFYRVMAYPGSGTGINTTPGAAVAPDHEITVTITFMNEGVAASGGPVLLTELPFSAFNFFIVSRQIRGREIHLPGYEPTDLIDVTYFGQDQDDTQPSIGKYFKTENNLPWAINVLQGFDYPIEKTPIDEAYLHFVEWAQSGGVLFPFWFGNDPGYRDSSKIY